jgi:DNA-binding CsgD family transcriptional regulator
MKSADNIPSNLFSFSKQLLSNPPEYYEGLLKDLLETHPVVKSFNSIDPMAYYIFSYVDLGIKFLTPNIYGRLFRVSEEEVQKKFHEFGMNYTFSIIHPADRKILAEVIAKEIPIALRDKVRYTNNYRAMRGDGTYGKYLSQFCVIPDRETGYPLIGLGTLTDITDQKTDNKIIFKAEFYDELSGHKEFVKTFVPADNPIAQLSERELEIAQLIAQGHSSEEIAEKLFISPFTVKAHKRNIFEKMNVHKATELASKL